MTRPAIFFDRDNTLIACDGYLGNPADVVLVEGAADAVARARALGYAAVIFSNQSGVARGMFAEDAVHAVNARLDELLQEDNPSAVIDRHAFCPYHPQATVERYRQDSDLRKPKPGMIHEAARQLHLDLSKSWVIGDAPRDIEAGHAAGLRTVLVKNPSLHASPAALEELTVPPEHVARNLKEAMDIVERSIAAQTPPAVAPAGVEESAASVPVVPEPTVTSSSAASTASPAVAPRRAQPRPATGPTAAASSPAAASTPAGASLDLSRTNDLLEQVLKELKIRNEADAPPDFSVPKLLSGIVQVLVLATLFFAYLNRDRPSLEPTLLLALVFQTLTISLIIMGRQR